MVLFAAIPKASENTTITTKPGAFSRLRVANRTSATNVSNMPSLFMVCLRVGAVHRERILHDGASVTPASRPLQTHSPTLTDERSRKKFRGHPLKPFAPRLYDLQF